MLDRRAVSISIGFAMMCGPALTAQKTIYRVNGTVTRRNFGGLESFLFNSLDTVIGLKIEFDANDTHQSGAILASAENSQFVAYRAGSGQESEIVAVEGFSFQHGSYVFDGFFVVKSGGMHQGVVSLFLDRTDEASVLLSRAAIKDIEVNRLKASIRKQ